MQVQPYLYFNGRCEEAIEFYKKALGAKVTMLMRFKDAPESSRAHISAGVENKIMHASLLIGDSVVSASDGRCTGEMKFDGVGLTLSVSNDADAERLFAALSDGGKVAMPMEKTFFSSRFGMVNDRFGVIWMVIVQH